MSMAIIVELTAGDIYGSIKINGVILFYAVFINNYCAFHKINAT